MRLMARNALAKTRATRASDARGGWSAIGRSSARARRDGLSQRPYNLVRQKDTKLITPVFLLHGA